METFKDKPEDFGAENKTMRGTEEQPADTSIQRVAMTDVQEKSTSVGADYMIMPTIEEQSTTIDAQNTLVPYVQEQPANVGADNMTLTTTEQSATNVVMPDTQEHPANVDAQNSLIPYVQEQPENVGADDMIMATTGSQLGYASTQGMIMPDTRQQPVDGATQNALIPYAQEQPGTAGADNMTLTTTGEQSANVGTPHRDSDEENQYALTPSPLSLSRTPPGATHPRSRVLISWTRPHAEPSLAPSRNCIACQEGIKFRNLDYCGPCSFEAGRWMVCDMCQRALPSVGYRGLCLNCVPKTPFEENWVWSPNTQSIRQLLGQNRIDVCLRCGSEKVFEKTCERVGSKTNRLNGEPIDLLWYTRDRPTAETITQPAEPQARRRGHRRTARQDNVPQAYAASPGYVQHFAAYPIAPPPGFPHAMAPPDPASVPLPPPPPGFVYAPIQSTIYHPPLLTPAAFQPMNYPVYPVSGHPMSNPTPGNPMTGEPMASYPMADNPNLIESNPMASYPTANYSLPSYPVPSNHMESNPIANYPTASYRMADNTNTMESNPMAGYPTASYSMPGYHMPSYPMPSNPMHMANNHTAGNPVASDPMADNPMLDNPSASYSMPGNHMDMAGNPVMTNPFYPGPPPEFRPQPVAGAVNRAPSEIAASFMTSPRFSEASGRVNREFAPPRRVTTPRPPRYLARPGSGFEQDSTPTASWGVASSIDQQESVDTDAATVGSPGSAVSATFIGK
ncbi:hypothetical protein ACHAPT_009715 [Fusarium lateritium]